MLLVYAEDGRDEVSLRARVPHDTPLRMQRTWADFEREAPTAAGLLVIADLDPDGILTERLRRVQTENPGHSLVLVTAPPSGDVRALQRVVADAVLWRNQLDQELWPTLATARADRLAWRGTADVTVAVALGRDLSTVTGYDVAGAVRTHAGRNRPLAASRAGAVLILLHPAEPKSARLAPQRTPVGDVIQDPDDGEIGISAVASSPLAAALSLHGTTIVPTLDGGGVQTMAEPCPDYAIVCDEPPPPPPPRRRVTRPGCRAW